VASGVPSIPEKLRGHLAMPAPNPFRITKSTDLTDRQILDLWVGFAPQSGGKGMYDPASPMPMVILGAKGSGKTHLIRYHSLAVRRLQFETEQISYLEGIRRDRYLGVYIRCNGLNSERFSGKGIPQDQWETVFSYYVELWFAQEIIAAVGTIPGLISDPSMEATLAQRIHGLLDNDGSDRPTSFRELTELLAARQRVLDRAVNNAAMTRKLDVSIDCGPGVLVFGIPRILREALPAFEDLLICYQIDEYENLYEWQQELINTLIRERASPVSFWIGARLWGMRTYRTRSAGEDLREGSEYELLKLDERLRQTPKDFSDFAKTMIVRRLEMVPDFHEFSVTDASFSNRLQDKFELFDLSWNSDRLQKLVTDVPSRDRPYFKTLKDQLTAAAKNGRAPGLSNGPHLENDVRRLIDCLETPNYPLIEKANVLILHQAWARRRDLPRTAETIKKDAQAYIGGRRPGKYAEIVGHYKADLIAQLLRAFDQPVPYSGIDNFITMSEGLPRALITILKHIYSWAEFDGETPFLQGKISLRAQLRGVTDAGSWFNEHMRKAGEDGTKVLVAMDRLAQLFRENRFSEKPVECSLITFSVSFDELPSGVRSVIQTATERMFLIEIPGGQKERNSFQVSRKYQINRMLSPRYQLPLGRRGAIPLSVRDADAIFDHTKTVEFTACLRRWRSKMNPPYHNRLGEHGPNLFEQL
jgi:hypothetical protein